MVLKSDDDIYNDIYGTLAVIRRILLEENLSESFSRGELMLGLVLSEFVHRIKIRTNTLVGACLY